LPSALSRELISFVLARNVVQGKPERESMLVPNHQYREDDKKRTPATLLTQLTGVRRSFVKRYRHHRHYQQRRNPSAKKAYL
jgi:hypothetical protein